MEIEIGTMLLIYVIGALLVFPIYGFIRGLGVKLSIDVVAASIGWPFIVGFYVLIAPPLVMIGFILGALYYGLEYIAVQISSRKKRKE